MSASAALSPPMPAPTIWMRIHSPASSPAKAGDPVNTDACDLPRGRSLLDTPLSRGMTKVRPHVPTDDPPRARRLFGDRRPPAAQAAGRSARRVLDHRQSGSGGHWQADGAPGAPRPDRVAAAARRAELELARIRHARRGVAAPV